MADLAPVLEGRKDIGPPEQLDVGVRAIGPDLFQKVLETNHGNRCLTSCRMVGYTPIDHASFGRFSGGRPTLT